MTHPLRQQLTRRRDCARRLPALDCGCRDPWTCPHRPEPDLTEHYVDGWRDAAAHLAAAGISAAVPVPVLRALWRRGGRDRELAEVLHRGVTA